jgi:deoxyadenosine/deoxycytidine kinase
MEVNHGHKKFHAREEIYVHKRVHVRRKINLDKRVHASEIIQKRNLHKKEIIKFHKQFHT